MFGFLGNRNKNKEEETKKPKLVSEYVPEHSLKYDDFRGEMESIDLHSLYAADESNRERQAQSGNVQSMDEITTGDVEEKLDPEKYMELEIQRIEEEEQALIEEEDRKNGKPLDLQTWELIQRERDERKAKKIAECRAKWMM